MAENEVLVPEAPEVSEVPEVPEVPAETSAETPQESPTETPEEMGIRLEEEREELVKERDRMGYDLRTLKDQQKLDQIELQNLRQANKPPEKSPFEGMVEEEGLTVGQAKGIFEAQELRLQTDYLTRLDLQKQAFSDGLARVRHSEDYDEVIAHYAKMALDNPTLERIAYFDQNPGEYRYQKGLEHPDLKAKATTKGKTEMVNRITKPRPRLPGKGGGGTAPGATTLQQAVDMSPEEWEAKPEEERVKFLQGG